jgi:hypothetical protein
MTGKLITLPLRVWFQSARLLTTAAGSVAGELAAVRLYESRHRSRQTVLTAVELKLGVGSAPA